MLISKQIMMMGYRESIVRETQRILLFGEPPDSRILTLNFINQFWREFNSQCYSHSVQISNRRCIEICSMMPAKKGKFEVTYNLPR